MERESDGIEQRETEKSVEEDTGTNARTGSMNSDEDTTKGKAPRGKKRMRKGFTKEQTDLIKQYFKSHIEKKEFSTTAEYQDFIALYPREFQFFENFFFMYAI